MGAQGRRADPASPGGRFLVEACRPEDVVTPADLSEEQRLIAATAGAFVEREILPRLQAILALDYEAIRGALRKAGELGLLGIEIPREYGGLGLDTLSACAACEPLAQEASFAVSYLAHTGMGTLPIVYFGTARQKERYLPRFASGEWISSYSLSEAGAGSDALSVQTRALPSTDGRYWLLDGEKRWLTNAGIADVYITFANVNGDRLSAFIVERKTPGVSLGPEEKKTGLNGSSTRALVFSAAEVPRENLLGGIGRGFEIALSSLNLGRLKLATANAAAVRFTLAEVVRYGTARIAFQRPLTDHGLIKEKIASMAVLAYAAEAVVYRIAGMIDRAVAGGGPDTAAVVRRIGEHDVECSLAKVWCSEALDYAVDETVQVFGAAGYVEDYPAERRWRDARINRIFEGTNEINRLVIASRLLRKALKGELAQPAPMPPAAGSLAREQRLLEAAKEVARLCLNTLARDAERALAEQESLGRLADIVLATYALESALLRTCKRVAPDRREQAELQAAAVSCLAQDALDQIEVTARRLLSTNAGDGTPRALEEVRRLLVREAVDTVPARRRLAEAAVEARGYPL